MALFKDSQGVMACPNAAAERRSQQGDRRKNHLSSIWYGAERRRRQIRRKEDLRRVSLLDHYSPKLLFWTALVIGLSLLDATLTLWLIDVGAQEVNPFLDHFLKIGPAAFIISKYLSTVLPLLIVIILNYLFIRRLRVYTHQLLYLFTCIFGAVVLWQLTLLNSYVF